MIHERQDFPVEVQVKEWIVQHFFPGLFDSNPHRIAEGTVRPGIPRMAPLKAGFELGVMGEAGVCPTHLAHPACTWTPSVHTRDGHAFVVRLCSLPAHAHNAATLTRVTSSLIHHSQAGCLVSLSPGLPSLLFLFCFPGQFTHLRKLGSSQQ